MKKYWNSVAVLAMVLTVFSLFSFREKNTLKDFDLKGKVKKVVLNDYSASNGPDGKIKPGAWIDSIAYNFNEDGKLMSAFTYRGKKSPVGTEEYTYDSEGHLKSQYKVLLNTTEDSSFYVYKNGLLVEKNSYGLNHDLDREHLRTFFGYKGDQIITESTVKENGDTIVRLINSYTDQGKISKIEYYELGADKQMNLKATKTYSYNAAGVMIGTNESEMCGGSVDNAWEYNQQGDRITAAVINSAFVMTTYNEYQYDAAGNWIKCTISFSQEETESLHPKKTPQNIKTRTITYY